MKQASFLPFFIVAVSFALGGAYVGYKHHAFEAPPKTASAPDLFVLELPDTSGKPQTLAQWRGKPLIVNFWATWCPPCVEEMPELSAFQTEASAKGAQIIGIGIDSAENIRGFTDKYKISYPLYIAGMNGINLSRQFGNKNGGLPFTVLINKDGVPVKTYIGRVHISQLRSELAGL
jgi:thiol-disulfide isomerase/thioredoxin